MKQFRIIWFPLVGTIFFIQWVIKKKTIPMYVSEYLLWVLYQAILIYIIFNII